MKVKGILSFLFLLMWWHIVFDVTVDDGILGHGFQTAHDVLCNVVGRRRGRRGIEWRGTGSGWRRRCRMSTRAALCPMRSMCDSRHHRLVAAWILHNSSMVWVRTRSGHGQVVNISTGGRFHGGC